jgi:DNA-binding cell septation regulator SpoVG
MGQMKIVSMSNVEWEKSPNIKATATLETSDGVQIKECKVVMGEFGVFVASPSKKASKPWEKTMKDGTTKTMYYDDLVFFPESIRQHLSEIVTDCYDPTKPNYKSYTPSGEMVSYNKANADKVVADGDIPF